MKEEHIKNLIEKYKSGTSSLEEEKVLFNSADTTDESIQKLSTFIKNNKKQAPENFNDTLWESFEKRIQNKTKTKLRFFIAAASLTLLFALYINNTTQQIQSIAEKEALLNEAKNMFTNIEIIDNQDIIFESDLIVVYTKTE